MGADVRQDLAQGETRDVTVQVTATDAHGATAVNDVTVTVTGVNDDPTLTAGALAATEDGAAVTLDLSALGDDVDSDDDGTSLSYAVTGTPAEGSASITGTTLSFAPGADFQDLAQGETRDVTVQVTATDAHGATAVNDVTVTVTGVNDAPQVTAINAGTVTEDDPVQTIDLLAGQTDVDNGAVLSAANISVTDNLGNAVAFTDNGDGTIAIDPAQFDALNTGQSRTLTVSYDVSEGIDGTANTATLVVNGVTDNLPPVANDDTLIGGAAGEFLVNSETYSAQHEPAVTALSGGGFVVTWASLDGVDDTSFRGIKAQIFDAGGAPVGGEFLVNSETNGSQYEPAVTALSSGGFVVTWSSNDGVDDTSGRGIKAQIFDASGAPVGGEFLINSETNNDQFTPAVTSLNGGGFVVTWSSYDGVDDTSGWGIKARIFDANGQPVGGEITDENTAHTIAAADLLGNDTDPDGDPLVISAVAATSALGATVTLNGDGSVSYDPTSSATLDAMAQGEVMTDTFTYTVSDGNGGTDTATVTLTVAGVDDPPILVGSVAAQSGFNDADFAYVIPAGLFSDHDEGGPISYDVTLADGSPLPSWLSFDAGTRTLSFAANALQSTDIGLYNLLITATEDDGQSATTGFTLTVLDGALIEGTPGDDNLSGTIQGDLILSYGGNDMITGLPGADVLDGGSGNDYLDGDAGDDVLTGGDGNDILYGGAGNDLLNGGAGGDYLQGENGSDTVNGGAGNDVLYADYDSASDDVLNGGDGNDTFHLVGRYSDDTVNGGAGDDVVNLQLSGNAHATITLGAGADQVNLSNSSITSYAQATITDFNTAEDSVNLDYLVNNRLSGWDGVSNPFGAGFLRLQQSGTSTLFQVDTNGGGDSFVTVLTFENTNIGDFTDQNFLIDVATSQGYSPDGSGVFGSTLSGTASAEGLNGTFGDDVISGLAGNDTLSGGNGADALNGGDGADVLTGGLGDDTMAGGAGNDTFVFAQGSGADRIDDFVVGTDVLSLTGSLAISSLAEVDTDATVGVDSTLVEFNDGSSVLLSSVLGVASAGDLL